MQIVSRRDIQEQEAIQKMREVRDALYEMVQSNHRLSSMERSTLQRCGSKLTTGIVWLTKGLNRD